jgi:hypothetical protein
VRVRGVRICLAGLALSLLVVGVVSGTLLRHVLQIVPIIIVLLVSLPRPAWAAYSAVALFAFWLFVAVMIWLFLLGLSRLANGHYTVTEIVCTVFMALFSAVGIASAVRPGKRLPVLWRVVAVLLFVALQVTVMMISFRPGIANR